MGEQAIQGSGSTPVTAQPAAADDEEESDEEESDGEGSEDDEEDEGEYWKKVMRYLLQSSPTTLGHSPPTHHHSRPLSEHSPPYSTHTTPTPQCMLCVSLISKFSGNVNLLYSFAPTPTIQYLRNYVSP